MGRGHFPQAHDAGRQKDRENAPQDQSRFLVSQSAAVPLCDKLICRRIFLILMTTDSLVTRFFALRPPVRSLVLLYGVYVFTGSLTWVFTQIFLYSRFSSISLNIVSTMLLYTGIMVGFCVFGYLASLWRLNIKYGFSISFLVLAASFVSFLFAATPAIAFVAVFLNGLGHGFFWLTIHTFELAETKDHERDFYSSLLSAGDQTLSLLGPAS